MNTLLADPFALKLEKMIPRNGAIMLVVRTIQAQAQCPQCQQPSSKVHSHYQRQAADLPWQGVAVGLQLHTRKFFCTNQECRQRIFCERLPVGRQGLPGVVAKYAHRTVRLNAALSIIGFALGGEAGAKTAIKLGFSVSPDSLLCRVRAAAAIEKKSEVRALGVDDFAFRRGQRYGTILVDLEQRRPIDLLNDREAESLEQWLKAHPEIEIITRDRAGAYADGARQGAPQAQQVADRWHLLKNINDAFERLIHRQHREVREAARKITPPPPMATATEVVQVVPATPSEYMRSRAERERRQRMHAVGKAQYDQVKDLQREGFTIVQIKKHLGWSYGRVARFYHADQYPVIQRGKGLPVGRQGKSCLDKFDAYLRERWAAGCHSAGQLYCELQAQGYRGSDVTVRRHVQLWRQERQKTLPPAPASVPIPAPRSCVWLLLKELEKLTNEELRLREAILVESQTIRQGQALVKSFRDAVCQRQGEKLQSWIEQAQRSGLPEFENFVKVLRRDAEAVLAAATSEWSNGQTEGQVNRLKMIKRAMYGRAKFDLLKARVLHAP